MSPAPPMDRFDPASIGAPEGGYTHGLAVAAKRLLFISGQTPEGPGGLPDGFDAQCEQVWANIVAVLDDAGLTVEHLVKVTTFLSDRSYAEANGRIRRRVLGDHRPALTVVIAGIFDPAWLVEIEAIAAVGEGRLRSTKVETQHLVEEADLDQMRPDALLLAPEGWWAESPYRRAAAGLHGRPASTAHRTLSRARHRCQRGAFGGADARRLRADREPPPVRGPRG